MRQSAGILLYRFREGVPEFFLVHPGGPFWEGREAGAWSIPKGEFADPESPLEAAVREFTEETGTRPEGPLLPLPPVTQKAGKKVWAWAAEGDLDAGAIRSNHFRMQWPPRSGKWILVPEVDKAGWFRWAEAATLINPAQVALLEALAAQLSFKPGP
ncbi:NUDIX domain-containing protein [Flaviaesturariibacter amylovorans]|uniref:NUDIX domain-containing protein n=1 Tax=Flaviaesturariibacter amylovorans TaxID=1084520 RepID=A0ABP8GV91_9BACT